MLNSHIGSTGNTSFDLIVLLAIKLFDLCFYPFGSVQMTQLLRDRLSAQCAPGSLDSVACYTLNISTPVFEYLLRYSPKLNLTKQLEVYIVLAAQMCG